MDQHLLGQTCALMAAISWAFAMVLFKRSGEEIAPLPLNLLKNTLAIALLVLTLGVLLIVTGNGVGTLPALARKDIAILILSGFLGITLADTLFFGALNRIGVGLISIVDCLYSPLIIFFSVILLAERPSVAQYIGTALIVAGVYISSGHAPPRGKTRAELLTGILLGILALVLMTYGIVIAKPILESLPKTWAATLWATMIRMLGGTLILALYALVVPGRKRYWGVFRPMPIWKVVMPACVIGGYGAMVFWIAGFQYTYAYIAGILNQTTVIFALILATIFLKERLTRRKLLAITLAGVGVVLVTLNPFHSKEKPPASQPAPQTTQQVAAQPE